MNEHIQKCINKLGSMAAVGFVGGVSPSMVWKMLHDKAPVTSTAVIPLEIAMEGEVTRHQLRPDLYPQE